MKPKLTPSHAVALFVALQEITTLHDIDHERLFHALRLMLHGEAYYSNSMQSWLCTSETRPNRFYVVDLQNSVCNCMDYLHRGTFCKHLLACWLAWRVEQIITQATEFRKEPEKYQPVRRVELQTT